MIINRDKICMGIKVCKSSCQYRGLWGEGLVGHHLLKKPAYPEYRFHPLNGVAVFGNCHIPKFHNDVDFIHQFYEAIDYDSRIAKMMKDDV